MSRDYRVYLDDILEAAERIEQYTSGIDLQQFIADNMRVDAVLRNFEIIGEATGHLAPQIRGKYSEVEWSKIIGLRNIIAHEYFRVNLPIIWSLIENDVTPLRIKVSAILEQEDEANPPQ